MHLPELTEDTKVRVIEGQLDNGYRDGEWEVYNESGVLLEKINYSMGEIIDSETY